MAFRTRNTSRGDKLTLLLRDSWMPMLLLIIIMITPVVVMAVALERYITKGILVGALKG